MLPMSRTAHEKLYVSSKAEVPFHATEGTFPYPRLCLQIYQYEMLCVSSSLVDPQVRKPLSACPFQSKLAFGVFLNEFFPRKLVISEKFCSAWWKVTASSRQPSSSSIHKSLAKSRPCSVTAVRVITIEHFIFGVVNHSPRQNSFLQDPSSLVPV